MAKTRKMRVLSHPVGLRPHTVERTGPAWARWSTLRLNDLDQAGPVCSASPGRRLTGWRHPSRSVRLPAGGMNFGSCTATDRSPWTAAGLSAVRGPLRVSRLSQGWNRRVGAQRSGRAPWPCGARSAALLRRRERPAKRAALNPYRKFSQTRYRLLIRARIPTRDSVRLD